MALIYNKETAVPRDFKQIDQEQTGFLNAFQIQGRTQEFQTNLVTYPLNCTDGNTVTTTVTDDFLLTSLSINIRASPGSSSASCTITMYINNTLFRTISTDSGATDAVVFNDNMVFNNCTIKAGTIFKTTMSANANAGITCNLTYVGYN